MIPHPSTFRCRRFPRITCRYFPMTIFHQPMRLLILTCMLTRLHLCPLSHLHSRSVVQVDERNKSQKTTDQHALEVPVSSCSYEDTSNIVHVPACFYWTEQEKLVMANERKVIRRLCLSDTCIHLYTAVATTPGFFLCSLIVISFFIVNQLSLHLCDSYFMMHEGQSMYLIGVISWSSEAGPPSKLLWEEL